MTVFGYVRVSTAEQNPDSQIETLKDAGAEEIIIEVATGKSMDRPKLTALLSKIKSGDTLLVSRLDRLGRTLSGVTKTLDELDHRKVGYRSIAEPIIDSTRNDSFSKAIAGVIAVFAQLERSMICERIREGVAIAKAQGRMQGRGRPKALGSLDVDALMAEAKVGERTVTDLCKRFRISRSTYYAILNKAKGAVGERDAYVSQTDPN